MLVSVAEMKEHAEAGRAVVRGQLASLEAGDGLYQRYELTPGFPVPAWKSAGAATSHRGATLSPRTGRRPARPGAPGRAIWSARMCADHDEVLRTLMRPGDDCAGVVREALAMWAASRGGGLS